MTPSIAKTAKITLIVDNNTPQGLIEEHGFSAWVEAGDQRIVFDTGQGLAFEHNARCLGLDLRLADALVLSHGHYDHTGGTPFFLSQNSHCRIFSAPGTGTCRYSRHPDQTPKMIGVNDAVSSALNELPAWRRVELDKQHYVAPGVGITGPIPRKSSFEDAGGPFYFDDKKAFPDAIDDDLSMWLETTEGLVILTGCCHSGLVNTINYIREITGNAHIHGIVGGLHLLNASDDRLEQTLKFIAGCNPDFLVPCHCTGQKVIDRLIREFGRARTTQSQAGQTYELGVMQESKPS